MARLFFGLWPDAAAAASLARAAEGLAVRTGGKPVPLKKIHLTLAFLDEIPSRRTADAASVAIVARAFPMTLDCVGSFQGARVAWAGCAAPPAALLELHSVLARDLRALGFGLEERAFAPHVTLVRGIKAQIRPERIDPVAWQAREFALMRSGPGADGYSVLKRWAMAG